MSELAGGADLAPLALRLLALRRAQPGHAEATLAEAVRFTIAPSLALPAAEAEVEDAAAPDGGPVRVRANLAGLVGAMGALPSAYTAVVADRRGRGDAALSDFVEGIQNPLLHLLLRAHLKHRFWLDHVSPGERPFARALHALVGVVDAPARTATGLPPTLFAHYCGLLQQPPSASVLGSLLSDALAVPVAVRQLTGSWTQLDDAPGSAGNGSLGGEAPPALGADTVLGDRVFLPTTGLDLDLGPLSLDRLISLLPGTDGARELIALARFVLGPQHAFAYRLHLHPDEAPPPTLAGDGAPPQRLGFTMWIADEARDAFVAGPFRVGGSTATTAP